MAAFTPSIEEVKNYRGDANAIPVYREIVADLETPVSAYLKISRGDYSFLLESIEGGQRLARYSFIGTEPYRIIRTLKEDGIDPLPQIEAEMARFRIAPSTDLPRFCGGAVGYLAYEVVSRFEKLPSPEADPLGLPESFFMFTDTLLIFDHVTHKIKVMSYVRLDGDIENSYRMATEKINDLVGKLQKPLECDLQAPISTQTKNGLTSNFTRGNFEKSVSRIKDYITAGEAIQVVPSQRLKQHTDAEPFEIYRALRTINPSPYMFYLDFKDFQIVGTSPEILVRVENGTVMTRPLAGTRRRGKDAAEDFALEQELRHDEKERAEHIMLVDLGRNDIGRVSEPGTVVVSDLMDIERYSHVMHMVTQVQGKLRRDMSVYDALRACFPAGTVSGAPKIRAMEIIAEIEPEKRGVYAGSAGYFSFNGNMDMAISIRTMVVKDGVAYTQAGGGIVYDSVPSEEFDESMNKARALLGAIRQAEEARAAKGE